MEMDDLEETEEVLDTRKELEVEESMDSPPWLMHNYSRCRRQLMIRPKLLSIPVLLFSLISCVTTNTPAGNEVTRASSERTSGSLFRNSIYQLAMAIQPPDTGTGTKKSIAILEFQASDISPTFAQQVQDHLLEEYFNLGRFKIIERESLDRILKEQNLQLSGVVNEAEAKRVGRIVGVDFISFGTIAKFNNVIRISGRTTSVETGEIVAISSVEIPIDGELSSMLGVTKSEEAVEKPKTSVLSKSPWTVTKKVNDFDGVTVYTFKSSGPATGILTIGYVKSKDPLKSYVRIGLSKWDFGPFSKEGGNFDIKDSTGTVHTIQLKWISWSEAKGKMNFGYGEYYLYTNTSKSRQLLSLLLDNDNLVVRCSPPLQYEKEVVQKFNTIGLKDTILVQGLTISEIEKAIANESF